MLFREHPSSIHIKVFECLSYVTTLEAYKLKFDSRAKKTCFLGYKDGTKRYIV